MEMKKSTIWLVLLIAAAITLSALPCPAVEDEGEDIRCEGSRPPVHGRHGHGGLTEEKIERIMERLAEAEPEKAKELEQLRKEDPEEFEKEIMEIMREVFREKFREHRRERPGFDKEGRFGRHLRRRHDEYIEWLEENRPEQAKELAELKEKDPELYNRRVGLGYKKHRRIIEALEENPELLEVSIKDTELKKQRDELVTKIRAAADQEQKEELKNELEGAIGERYDLILERKQIKYKRLLKKLEMLKKEVEKSEAAVEKWKDAEFKKQNVKKRVDELLGESDVFKWH